MTKTSRHYKIVIVEPSIIISTGLKHLIEQKKEFEVTAVIADYYHYMEKINHLLPDVIVINPSVVDMKKRQHLEEVFTELKDTAFIALIYQYVEPEVVKQFHAVIDISDDGERIIQKLSQAIDAVNTPPDVAEKNELSEREKEVLVALARGKINKEIAEIYHISIHTVITHRKNIIRKTGIKSISGLTVYAILNNLISINDVE